MCEPTSSWRSRRSTRRRSSRSARSKSSAASVTPTSCSYSRSWQPRPRSTRHGVSPRRRALFTAHRYFQQLISTMAFCHARGVFHRDLKPENLLVHENGDLKISDFGLSAVAEHSRGSDGLLRIFCSTPAYVALEVLSRRGYDGAKVDIWSCGVIIFVLMAGYHPFHDCNIVAMYRKIYKGDFRCPRFFSLELIRLLRRLLDTNPRTRITIPAIVADKWFEKGFRQVQFPTNDDLHSLDDPQMQNDKPEGSLWETESDCSAMSLSSTLSEENRRVHHLSKPLSLNAFDIISFSKGFDISGLFDERGDETRFLSKEPMSAIITKLEEIAKSVSFKVKRKDCRVSLEGTREGEKGHLTIAAEIFELTPR